MPPSKMCNLSSYPDRRLPSGFSAASLLASVRSPSLTLQFSIYPPSHFFSPFLYFPYFLFFVLLFIFVVFFLPASPPRPSLLYPHQSLLQGHSVTTCQGPDTHGRFHSLVQCLRKRPNEKNSSSFQVFSFTSDCRKVRWLYIAPSSSARSPCRVFRSYNRPHNKLHFFRSGAYESEI